jgi:hypothetical protein
MNTQISSKLTALAVALILNSLIFGGVALLFNGQIQQHSITISLAGAATHAAYEARDAALDPRAAQVVA